MANLVAIDCKPRWNSELREFWLGETLIKAFHRLAPAVELIVQAFEEEHWTRRIDDPLSPLSSSREEKDRLRGQIQALNHCLNTTLIRFSMDGTGQGIVWQLVGAETEAAARPSEF